MTLKLRVFFVFSFSFYLTAADEGLADHFKQCLLSIKHQVGSSNQKRCFISCATDDPDQDSHNFVIGALITSGMKVVYAEGRVSFLGNYLDSDQKLEFGGDIQKFMDNIDNVDFVVPLYTQKYFARSKDRSYSWSSTRVRKNLQADKTGSKR